MSKSRVVAILAIFLIVGGMFFVAKARNIKKDVKTTDQIQKEVGIPVQTAVVQLGRIADTVPVTGDITALENVTLMRNLPLDKPRRGCSQHLHGFLRLKHQHQ